MALLARFVLPPVIFAVFFAAANHWDWRIGALGALVGMFLAISTRKYYQDDQSYQYADEPVRTEESGHS